MTRPSSPFARRLPTKTRSVGALQVDQGYIFVHSQSRCRPQLARRCGHLILVEGQLTFSCRGLGADSVAVRAAAPPNKQTPRDSRERAIVRKRRTHTSFKLWAWARNKPRKGLFGHSCFINTECCFGIPETRTHVSACVSSVLQDDSCLEEPNAPRPVQAAGPQIARVANGRPCQRSG